MSARKKLGAVALIAGLSATGAPAAMAKDYGTVGTTWSIAEPDLLTVIHARLLAAQNSGALDSMNRKFALTAQASANRPHAVGGMSPAQTTREWSYDPTVTIAEDIRDARGNLIAAKGQKFNPLTKIGMAHAFAFVDGDNAEQMAWAVRQGDPDKLWIVLVSGSPIERMKEFKRRFYFDQQGVLTSKFGITHTPALLSQRGNVVDIREVALPRVGGGQ